MPDSGRGSWIGKGWTSCGSASQLFGIWCQESRVAILRCAARFDALPRQLCLPACLRSVFLSSFDSRKPVEQLVRANKTASKRTVRRTSRVANLYPMHAMFVAALLHRIRGNPGASTVTLVTLAGTIPSSPVGQWNSATVEAFSAPMRMTLACLRKASMLHGHISKLFL